MKKTALTKAALLALATFGASAAFAQSSLTIYGNLDIAVDRFDRDGSKTVDGFTGLPTAQTADQKLTRLTSSISSVNALGFRGTEDLGGGWKGGFVLEGQFQLDSGAQSGQDNRMWGRQAFVSLTTPGGEIRLGRQYAPMFFSFALTTVEALGGADIQGSGLVVNNLQVRQDNQISYNLKSGGLTFIASYSPNAGVDQKISALRGQSTPATNGQIVGGQGAGNEVADSGNRGQSIGLLLAYNFDFGLSVNGAYHTNKFGNAQLVSASPATLGALLADLDKYDAYGINAKYTIPGAGTVISGNYHIGKYHYDASNTLGDSPEIETFAFGVKHPIGNFAVGLQYAHSKFKNFTEGKDNALMLIGDYNFSKRTKVYLRAGYMKDDEGDVARTGRGAAVVGGPAPLLTNLGALETPYFSGAGAAVGGTTSVVAIGIRHQF
jgi:predicted porin